MEQKQTKLQKVDRNMAQRLQISENVNMHTVP